MTNRKIAMGVVLLIGILLTVLMARGSYRIGTGLAFGNYIRGVESEYSELLGTEVHDAAVVAASQTGMVYAATTIFSTAIPLTGLLLAAIWSATSKHVRLRNLLYAGIVYTVVAAVAMGLTSRIIDSGDFSAGFAGGIMMWLFITLIVYVTTVLVTRKKRRREKFEGDENLEDSAVSSDPRYKEKVIARNALAALDQLRNEYPHGPVLGLIDKIKHSVKKDRWALAELIDSTDQEVATEWAYSVLGNVIGDLLESGKYHIYRNTLSLEGMTLLETFDSTYDRLVEMKTSEIDAEYAESQKAGLRENISVVG